MTRSGMKLRIIAWLKESGQVYVLGRGWDIIVMGPSGMRTHIEIISDEEHSCERVQLVAGKILFHSKHIQRIGRASYLIAVPAKRGWANACRNFPAWYKNRTQLHFCFINGRDLQIFLPKQGLSRCKITSTKQPIGQE